MFINWGQIRWINYQTIQWRRNSYHRWWKIITLWVTVLSIKAPVIMRSVLWISGWVLTNRGYLRCIDDWIIQWRRHGYHRLGRIIALLVTFLDIKAPFITRNCSLPTLIFLCSTFLATTNTLWKWHDEFNMTLWWCCVPIMFLGMAIKRWEPTFWCNNCSHVWVSVPGIKLITRFLSQYHHN